MPDTQQKIDLKVLLPLVVAHQFYRLFKANPDQRLVLLAADALNKTRPTEGLRERLATRAAGESDSLFLLKNLDCVESVPPDAWPKRQLNKSKWNEFALVMEGLELYLRHQGEFRQTTAAPPQTDSIEALLSFASFDIREECDQAVLQSLEDEQARFTRTLLEQILPRQQVGAGYATARSCRLN